MTKNPFLSKAYKWNRPKKKDNPEGRLQMQIIRYLKIKGYTVGKTKTMGVVRNKNYCFDPYAFRGFPDLTCFCPQLVFIECKSPRGTLNPTQKDFQKLCQNAGIPYILARSLEDVSEVIK